MRIKTKKLLQNITLSLIVIVLLLVFFEITLRVLNIIPGYDYPKGIYEKDLLLGYSMTPNFIGKLIKPEFETQIVTNSQGLRDVEFGEKGEKEYRILAIGDSFTWGGYGSELEETYLKILEKKLNQKGNINFKVINAGVPGYNNKQEYLYLKERGINYEPDMVLLSFVLNDFIENPINLSDIVIKDGVKVTDESKSGTVFRIRSFLLINFWSYRFIERGVTNLLGKFIQRFISKDIRDDKKLAGLFLKNTPDDTKKEIEFTFKILDDMNNFLKEKNVPFVIVIMPLKYQVNDDLKQSFIKINKLKFEELDFEKPQTIIQEWARKNNVTVINLLPDLKSKDRNNDFYWDLNPHFNKKGNKEVADIIFDKLIDLK